MQTFSREHQAVYDFKVAYAQLRPLIDEETSDDYRSFFDSFEGAISNFILTELHIRQGERCDALDVFSDLKTFSFDFGNSLNTQGISYLQSSKDYLVTFKNDLPSQPATDNDFQTFLQDYKSNMIKALSQIEFSASDCLQISDAIDETLASLATGNTGVDLLDYTIGKMQDLIDARGTTSRGAAILVPVPIWKIIAACVMFGISFWAIYKCYYSIRGCSKKEQAIYGVILTIAVLVFKACK